MPMNVHLICLVIFISARVIVPDEFQQPAEKTSTNQTNQTGSTDTARGRRKRFDYEDNYEWEDDDDLTYEDYYQEEAEEPNLFQKIALHWRKAGPRVVCLGALVIVIILMYCACFRLACRFWCKSMQENCACCCMPGVKQLCQSCYTDPMYERVKDLGEAMGIEITFNTFERIKDHYVPDSGFDPAQRPLLL